MNQRLIVILAVVLVLAGIVGIVFSENEAPDSAAQQQTVLKDVNYFVTKRAMAVGERITDSDVQKETEKVAEDAASSDDPISVTGLYLTESVVKGTRLTAKLITDEKPTDDILGQSMFRFTVPLDKRYANNLIGIIPGDSVDVYLRFSSPKREHDNKSTIFRGESMVKIVKVFRARKVLSPLMKGDKAAVEEESKALFSDGQLLNANADFTIDIELSRTDLKKIYQVENQFDMILFPTEKPVKAIKNSQVNNRDRGGK